MVVREPESSVAIVGVGLIGGSLAAALRQRGFQGSIIGVGRDATRLAPAVERGWLSHATEDLAAAAAQCSLIVFCTPVERIPPGVAIAARAARPGTLLTDCGSAKSWICAQVDDISFPPDVSFVGGHPLAGSEQQGFEYSDPHLFDGRVCVLTPQPHTPPEQTRRLADWWRGLGSRVLEVSPAAHDQALARTSHLPHVAAAALAATLPDELRDFAATGFRDSTRVAAGDPDLWVSILDTNREPVLEALGELRANLDRYIEVLSQRDSAGLKLLLEQAKRNRRALDDPSA